MGNYKNKTWYIELRDKDIEEFGDVPPPWVKYPTYHPYSMGWRMGSGETHLMVLNEWFDAQKFTFEERLVYVKKYPCSPMWYGWIVHFLLEVDTIEFYEEEEYFPYFEKLKELGFKDTDKFVEDLNREDMD